MGLLKDVAQLDLMMRGLTESLAAAAQLESAAALPETAAALLAVAVGRSASRFDLLACSACSFGVFGLLPTTLVTCRLVRLSEEERRFI